MKSLLLFLALVASASGQWAEGRSIEQMTFKEKIRYFEALHQVDSAREHLEAVSREIAESHRAGRDLEAQVYQQGFVALTDRH